MIKFLSKTNKKNIAGTALLRLDFNTQDDWRMKATLPTLKFLCETSKNIVIMSHRGRPQNVVIKDGTIISCDKSLSLRDDAKNLSHLLKRKIIFIEHFRFDEIKETIKKSQKGSIFLLENLRFVEGEEKNDKSFAKELASLGDFYVNDAFAVSHRANASICSITDFLPHYAGLELEKEIKYLGAVMEKPKRPLIFIIGGAKVSDKLAVIKFFKNKTDQFILGGGSLNTILSLRGMDVKKSLIDNDEKDVKELKSISKYKNIIQPVDFTWKKDAIVDLGIKSANLFAKYISKAKTIIWSGPVGMADKGEDKGSILIAKAVVSNKKAISIAGGGETVLFLKKKKFDKKFSFISTGGGALLDFLAGKKLPGIVALEK
jgi:phosphoglycerate kinase